MEKLFILIFPELIPVFTKWVLENPEELVPVFSYDILFLFVNSTFILLAKSAVNKKKLHDLYEKHHEENDNEKSILNLIIMAFIVLVLVVIAIKISEASIILFMGFHILSSLSNVLWEDKNIFSKLFWKE